MNAFGEEVGRREKIESRPGAEDSGIIADSENDAAVAREIDGAAADPFDKPKFTQRAESNQGRSYPGTMAVLSVRRREGGGRFSACGRFVGRPSDSRTGFAWGGVFPVADGRLGAGDSRAFLRT